MLYFSKKKKGGKQKYVQNSLKYVYTQVNLVPTYVCILKSLMLASTWDLKSNTNQLKTLKYATYQALKVAHFAKSLLKLTY